MDVTVELAPVFDNAAFVVRPADGERPNLPPSTGPRALIVDLRWPRPDQDACSLEAVIQARALKNLGYEVIFAGMDDYAEDSPYRVRLEAEGVVCLSPDKSPSIEAFLRSDGRSLALCILVRVDSGGSYLEAVRQHAPQAKVIFHTMDLHFIRGEREARVKGDAAMLRQAEATRERELYVVRQADATIVVSETERALLVYSVPGAPVTPLTRPARPDGQIPGFEARCGVGFVGGFEHSPNVDAVRYLLDKIWPHVLKRLPAAQLSIVRIALPENVIPATATGVRYLGHLPDLDSWLDGLRLTVAPLRYGAGTKGKVASSLAAGVPCVGTPIAAEGMRLEDAVHIAIATSPEDFAARICEVHENPGYWARLSEGGFEKARSEFSIKANEKRLAALLIALGLPNRQQQVGKGDWQ
jgi:glycosyltransferase involved in cell wall biosynthesis